jgi:hypothetical protein
MKKIRGDKLIASYNTYIHGSITGQLHYLYLKEAKMSYFSFSLSIFSSTNQRTGG